MTTAGERTGSPRSGRVRAVLSAVLIVIGLVLGTLGVVTGLVRTTLTDTEGFVSMLAPLATEPAVQDVVSDAVTAAVEDAVDIPALTAQVFDGIRDLGLSDRASSALDLLEGPAVQGLTSLLGGIVRETVTSDAFAEVWEQTLRVSHRQIIATLHGDAGAALAIGDGGSLDLQLGPVVEAVRERLIAQGVVFAQAIPEVDRSIVLVEDASLGRVATIYGLTVAVATWLPAVALVVLAAGILLARDRRRALFATAIGGGLLLLALIAALSIGRAVVIGQLVGLGGAVTPQAGGIAYDAVTASVSATAGWLVALAAVVAFATWLAGPGRIPRSIRRAATDATRGIRRRNRWRSTDPIE